MHIAFHSLYDLHLYKGKDRDDQYILLLILRAHLQNGSAWFVFTI